eukprot:1157822-Pelagomonas_calceolata.AAC.31
MGVGIFLKGKPGGVTKRTAFKVDTGAGYGLGHADCEALDTVFAFWLGGVKKGDVRVALENGSEKTQY